MSKKEAPLHQHRRKEVDKNRGGKRKWQNKRGTNSSVWEWRWHGSRCVNVLEIWSIPSRRHHFLFFAEEEEKRWLIPLFFLVARSMGISCYQGIIHLGAEIYIEKRVSYASRVTHRRGFPGSRRAIARVTVGNDPIMVSRDSIRPLSFVIIANSRRSAACYRVNGRARSDPASVFSGFSASLG